MDASPNFKLVLSTHLIQKLSSRQYDFLCIFSRAARVNFAKKGGSFKTINFKTSHL